MVYSMTRERAVAEGVVREARLDLSKTKTETEVFASIAARVRARLDADDKLSPTKHQAIVMVATKVKAEEFARVYGAGAETFVSGDKDETKLDRFKTGGFRVVVVVKLLNEGYDNSRVSVVGYGRRATDHGDVEQFVGRAMRVDRTLMLDPVKFATVVSDERFMTQSFFDDAMSGTYMD